LYFSIFIKAYGVCPAHAGHTHQEDKEDIYSTFRQQSKQRQEKQELENTFKKYLMVKA
jgi:hypothetical protein